jgi:Uma2 family endonuclease
MNIEIQLPPRVFGPESSGILMTPEEFDRAEFEEGWRYELIHGVLVVNPIPEAAIRAANDLLSYLLRNYQDQSPSGAVLNATLYAQPVRTAAGWRMAERVVWIGLPRHPRRRDVPTVVADFVRSSRRHWPRDYEARRDEYLAVGVREYWVFDRFKSTVTVFTPAPDGFRSKTYRRRQTLKTPLLPGFALPLARLFALAERWPEEDEPGG